MKIGIAGPIQTAPFVEYLENVNLNKTPKGLGGTNVINLIKSLLGLGFNVSVYSLDIGISTPVVLQGPLLTIFYGPYRQRYRMHDFMKLERKTIRDFINMDNPEVVNAHWTYEFAMGALASAKPTVITVRDWAPAILRQIPRPYRFARLLMQIYVLKRAKNLVGVSPYICDRIKKKYFKRAYLIPNGVGQEFLRNSKKEFNKICPKIVAFGDGIFGRKNIISLLHAFPLIRNEMPNIKLVLIGPGLGIQEDGYKWAKANNLEKEVQFIGLIPYSNVESYLEEADLLIHPSKEESFGMTLIEGMAKKIPVIGGIRSGAVPWVLNYGKAGVLVDVDYPEAIAKEAIHMLANEDRWQYYSDAGYRFVLENFVIDKFVDKYLNIFIQALKT